MTTPLTPENRVLVTSVDALLATGHRITWQSYRKKKADPDSLPTEYFATLTATEGTDPTIISLKEIGAQAPDHLVVVSMVGGSATVTYADGTSEPLEPGVGEASLPGYGAGNGATLSFTDDCITIRAKPKWNTQTVKAMGGDPAPPPPPPPFPGNGDR